MVELSKIPDLSANAIVTASHVSKSFGSTPAVADVNFQIYPGECFGLLGPNGAGKSTLIKMIYGVLSPDHGSISTLNFDPHLDAGRLRSSIGVVLQDDALDLAMSVQDNMLMFCRFHSIPKDQARQRVSELLKYMELSEKANDRIATLSGGMKRRLAFVRSLLPDPKLLILDEPTTGLDPAVRQLLWDKIHDLKKRGTTIILTTHYMDEAQILCDRLIFVDQGRVRAQGSPRELVETYCPGFVALFLSDNGVSKHQRLESHSLADLIQLVHEMKHTPEILRPCNLEDVFLKITGRDFNV